MGLLFTHLEALRTSEQVSGMLRCDHPWRNAQRHFQSLGSAQTLGFFLEPRPKADKDSAGTRLPAESSRRKRPSGLFPSCHPSAPTRGCFGVTPTDGSHTGVCLPFALHQHLGANGLNIRCRGMAESRPHWTVVQFLGSQRSLPHICGANGLYATIRGANGLDSDRNSRRVS